MGLIKKIFYPEFMRRFDTWLLERQPLVWQTRAHVITFWNLLLLLPEVLIVYSLPIGYYLYQSPNWSYVLTGIYLAYCIGYLFYRINTTPNLAINQYTDFVKIYFLLFWNFIIFWLVLYFFLLPISF